MVAVVGDGALTCGLSYEGMNNAGHSDRDILLIVNDNGMSISPNVGAIAKLLGTIVANPRTDRVREHVKRVTHRLGHVFGDGVVEFARNVEESVKNLFSEGMLFEELGFRYFGPIDGHDLAKLGDTLAFVGRMMGPRVLHVLTEKGKGFSFAEANREKWHGLAAYDPQTGEARKKASGPPTWTQLFGDALTALGEEHPELVTITAAMPSGTGTSIFAKKYPRRFFDVGIAEGHAVTFAGGLATQGVRPVVAILLDVSAARIRQHHPRHRRAASSRALLHGPRGPCRRGWPDAHGPVRHCLHACRAGNDRDGTERRR